MPTTVSPEYVNPLNTSLALVPLRLRVFDIVGQSIVVSSSVKAGSKHDVSSSEETFGLNGGGTCLLQSASQSIAAKNGWFLISSAS